MCVRSKQADSLWARVAVVAEGKVWVPTPPLSPVSLWAGLAEGADLKAEMRRLWRQVLWGLRGGFRGRGPWKRLPAGTPLFNCFVCDGEEVSIKQHHASLWLMWFLKCGVGRAGGLPPFPAKCKHAHRHTRMHARVQHSFIPETHRGHVQLQYHDPALFLITGHGPRKYPDVSPEMV